MRIGTTLSYAGGFTEVVDELAELEKVGLDIAFVAEAYSYDAASQLGYLAAKTSTVKLASGIFQLYTRTPTLLAMTAAGLDYVSGGRFVLGIGASGPQVIEGFHGVKYDAPLGRTRETVEICRKVWRRERLEFEGKYFTVPLPPEQGTGLGKALKLINHPVRDRIPVLIAALGPKNVALTAEIAEGWQPIFFLPEKAHDVWGAALAEGKAKRDPALGDLEVYAGPALAIGDDVEALYGFVKPSLALYIGGMGAKGKNFYHNLATAYGFGKEADTIQELYLSGKKAEATEAVPDELVKNISLIGPKSFVAERVAAFKEAGVTTLNVAPLAADAAGRIKHVEALRELL
ncbi:LLM class F420-dependent oxidoreductase [Mycobacteroides abscessus]|uniref:Coenzyme F420-dependent N5,N10-methenyltetrahydromethanopterin reductase n=3 Tax=Mycobacteroides abscessus TaxID=36809 RepID=A0A1T7E085_9MYCO|nr:LLM class F420-dependent oxidoreductase [Mycobacteroides abscessus]EUA67205.1 putative F420-dependent oxidoreductase family protein [Mycobacteroides abscessus subsp. bolletii 1513]AGM30362.1 coenzyme F420-dependent N5,N10-methenyltetrahydromethanopterin reductase [Mycobacteroides abscessus subsp. bolletii 50594]AMU32278.1 LLM class F420-dependent oxidoreductase [Mycobacteroides abscessus]AMU67065.1 LLM class F420-dependent oxidoreductase [Mycobacteroides abscessus]AMU76736.1 LLM class F420-